MHDPFPDALDSEADRAASVSTNRYEASLFMTTSRTLKVTRRVLSMISAGVKAGRYSRRDLLMDSNHREEVLDRLIGKVVADLYTEVMRAAGDIRDPRPGSGLVRQLSNAYRKKTRGLLSLVRLALKGSGLVFEDEPDRIRPTISPGALARAALGRARRLQERYLRAGMRPLSATTRRQMKGDLDMLTRMLGQVIGSGGLRQSEIDEIARVMTGLQTRLAD
jgi:hypothetical protein